MRIYIGADHRGFSLKEIIVRWVTTLGGYEVNDYGAYNYDPEDDYVLYAEKVAVVIGKDQRARGILICGSGVGVDVVANKFDGVRSAIGKEADQVIAGRNDDDMNLLVIASDFTSETEAKALILAFLNTKFSGIERYKRRLKEIKRIEENN